MIIVLIGASGSGKSTIEKELSTHYGYKKIISYTTRLKRPNETNCDDYYFTNLATFIDMKNNHLFAEYDEYSQNRMYGTLKIDYKSEENKVVVLTPNGFRKVKQSCPDEDIFSVLINAPLGTRVKRYINRCGETKFNFDDMNEINARVNRDFGMFVGMEKEVDYVLNNNGDIKSAVNELINFINER